MSPTAKKIASKGKAAAQPAAKTTRVTRPKIVRAAVIGVSMGSHHARSIAKNPQARLVALCDLNLERANALAQELGGPRVTSDYREVVAAKDVDAVIIATPNVHHAPMALAAFKAGKHVCCEKPLAMTPAEANQMVEEMMLLANCTVAEHILRAFSACALLRRHPTPPPRQFEPLLAAAAAAGISLDPSTSKVRSRLD